MFFSINIKKRDFVLFFLFLFFPTLSWAHSGRTDSQGGHHNRKTGEYHYHNKRTTKSPSNQSSTTPSRHLSSSKKPNQIHSNALVTQVIDGNTLVVEINGVKETIKMKNIEIPELGTEKGDACKNYLKKLVEDKVVVLRHNNIRDTNNYLLADAYWQSLSLKVMMQNFIEK